MRATRHQIEPERPYVTAETLKRVVDAAGTGGGGGGGGGSTGDMATVTRAMLEFITS